MPHLNRRAVASILGLGALGFVSATPLAGQSLVHESWGIEDGLPLSHLTGIVFARDGYLWLSSFDGLIRFDGARFTVFNTATNPELPTNRFRHIVQGPDGTLWAAAEFDYLVRQAADSFEVLALPGVRGASIRGLRFGPEESLWVVTNQGMFVLRDGVLTPLPPPRRNLQSAVYWDREGTAWVGTDGAGALRWREGAFEYVNNAQLGPGRFVSGFAEDSDGALYMGTGSGVAVRRNGSLERLLPSPAGDVDDLFVRHLRRMGGDSILVIADQGVFDLVSGRLSRRIRAGTRSSIPPQLVRAPDGTLWMSLEDDVYRDDQLVFDGRFPIYGLALDHENSLWIAADGLHRLKRGVFDVYGEPEGSVRNVYGLMEDSRDRIWLASLGPTARYEDGEFTVLPEMPELAQTFVEDRGGDILIGRVNYGACRVVGAACPDPIDVVSQHSVKALYEDRAGNLWMGTDRGVFRDSAGIVSRFGVEAGLAHDFVRVIRQTQDDAIWFGTNGGGISRYAGGRIESLTNAGGLPSDLVRALHEDDRGAMWIGTEDGGLVRLAFAAGASDEFPPLSSASITAIGRREGLYDDGIHTILDDGQGRFWMSTNRGIFWVLKSELDDFAAGRISRVHSISYTERDGLRNREANGGVQSAAIVAADGRLWFATQAGVAVVDPSRIHRTDIPFPIRIETLRTGSNPPRFIPGPRPADTALRIEAGDRDFEVAYTALSFLAPENLRFQYRLAGLQEEWVDAGNRRTAFFTNVPPGRFEFHVRATRGDGTWREAEAPLRLVVEPFVHETLPFRLSVVAALGLLGLLGLNTRERRHQRRAEELSALVAERTATVEAQAERLVELDAAKSRFFANVSHEFRTPLTLTIGPLEDLQSGLYGPMSEPAADQIGLSLRNSRRLLRLVNQLMEIARLEAGAVQVQAAEGNLTTFLADVLRAFEPLAERQRIETELDMPAEALMAFFDPELLERVVVNLLSNAFKFTPEEGTIRLAARAEHDGWLSIEVRDSGSGIPADRLPHIFDRFYQADASLEARRGGTGIGLSVARELVNLHGGRLEVDSSPGFGSAFTIWLRTGSAHLAADQLLPGRAEYSVARVAARSDEGPGLGDSDAEAEAGADEADEADVPIVLVVEDNAEIVAYLRAHLSPRFRVIEACDGLDALDKAREELPDVIVSDVMMPRMTGLQLVEALQADRELAYVPVLLLTARADKRDKLEALDLGAADYLTKPFDMAELESRIANLIATRRRLEERNAREALLRPRPVKIESSVDRFLARVRQIVEANLADETFHVRELARAMHESRSTLYRQLMEVCGKNPSDVIRAIRLERAAQWLASGDTSVGSVAYAVGFKSVSHFSRSFREAYGVPPSRYADSLVDAGTEVDPA